MPPPVWPAPRSVRARARKDSLANRRPTGRYVYESSSDDDTDGRAATYVGTGARWHTGNATSLHGAGSDEDDPDSSSAGSSSPVQPAAREIWQIRLANQVDPWDRWEEDCRHRAWHTAARRSSRARSTVTPARERDRGDKSVDEVVSMLAHFQLQQAEAERKDREAFDARNATLWEGIEHAIRAAEQHAADEAAQLARAQRKQAQAEADAKRAREAEFVRVEAEKEDEKQRAERAAAAQHAQEAAFAAETRANEFRGGEHTVAAAAREYAHWRARMAYVKQDILPSIAANAAWRKQCFAAKRAITPKIGQLTNASAEIARIVHALDDILSQARAVPDADAQHRLYYWVLNHLSKCLIRQAEQEVAARQETAFPLARVALGLMLRGHSALGDVLMARLVKKCPYVLGYVPERRPSDDERTYRRMLGARPDAEESAHMFAGRMAGICALYFACLQTALPSVAGCSGLPAGVDLPHAARSLPAPFRPSCLWAWEVRGTTPPLSQHTLIPSLWCTFLEVAGPAVPARYGAQARKLWLLLLREGVEARKLGPAEDSEALRAARVRLQLILDVAVAHGSLGEHATEGRDMEGG
ncbi:Nuclear pore complex nucleoporin component [Malassezia sp. CBS 17886]|nr:Nuclear pore complex nucleoporin component [Malassezia sp. CBS 17886]